MNNAVMKVIRFDEKDVIATSGLETLAFRNISDGVAGNAEMSINGGAWQAADLNYLKTTYDIVDNTTEVFWTANDSGRMMWSLRDALSTTNAPDSSPNGYGGDSTWNGTVGYNNWNQTFYYYGGQFHRVAPKQ